MNKIIKSTIAICAVFAAATAFGDPAHSTNRSAIQATIYNANNDYVQVYIIVDHRFPDTNYFGLSGDIGGLYFDCGAVRGAVVTNMLDVPPTATRATVQVNTSLFHCAYGTPPAQISMNCVANGEWFEEGVSRGMFSFNGVPLKLHHNSKIASINCTGKADELVFDIPGYAYAEHRQYIDPQ